MYLDLQELRDRIAYANFNINYQDQNGETYLISSILKRDYDTSFYLINNGIDCFITDLNQQTAIDYLINLDIANILSLIIEHYPTHDYRPYYLKAVELARTSIIRTFHHYNIIPDIKYTINNENVFYKAIRSQNKEYYDCYYNKTLVSRKDGYNALFLALEINNIYALTELIKNHQNLINHQYNNRRLLDLAFLKKDQSLINFLLKNGAFIFLTKYENHPLYQIYQDPNANYKSLYKLHTAVLQGEKNLDLNLYDLMVKDPYGNTPLDYANLEQKVIINNHLKQIKKK